MRAQARSIVAKGIRALIRQGALQERLATALPETTWLRKDAAAFGALTRDERTILDRIAQVDTRQAVLALSDDEAEALASDWWALFDSLSMTSP